MTAAPENLVELCELLSCANTRRAPVGVVDLSRLNRVIEHAPEDMTVTVESGITVAALQSAVARGGQWLPIDPPEPERMTIHALISNNLHGPRRFGFGTIRDSLIGIRVALADGTLIRSGGKVVKNVAGYDLLKLFVGGRGTLGIIVEATFKLRPLPEAEVFLQARCKSTSEAGRLVEAVLDSELASVVLDLHQLSMDAPVTAIVGFAGTRAEVEWQVQRANELGFSDAATLDYDAAFRAANPAPHVVSVLPSRVAGKVLELNAPFVARAGNGAIYHRGAAPTLGRSSGTEKLMRRLKDTFDPNRIFPELPR